MSTIVTREGKGSALTYAEVDGNFTNLNTDKVESTATSAVDGEIALYSGTGGKTIKRASTSGVLKATSGVLSAATAGTDYVSPSGAETLSSKRITPRLTTNGATTSGTLTIAGDATDQYNVSGLTGAITFGVPSGSPAGGQKLVIRIIAGAAYGITWTTSAGGFRIIGTTLPTTTVANKYIYVGCLYNAVDSFWDVVAVTTQA